MTFWFSGLKCELWLFPHEVLSSCCPLLIFLSVCSFFSPTSQYIADIEDHLGVTVPIVDNTFDVEVDEFEGKVSYGEKRKAGGGFMYEGHIEQLAPSVAELAGMERLAQSSFLKMRSSKHSW